LGTSNAGYPYGTGQAAPPTADDSLDFATYSRDVNSGLEYAINRYYSAGYGRFLTPDAFGGSGKAGNPASWNRYTYSLGDPINSRDPSGLCAASYAGICDYGYCPPQYQTCDYGPPGTESGINDPSQGNCGATTGFVDGDADNNTVGDGTGCVTPPPPPPPPDPPDLVVDGEDGGTGVAGNVLAWLPVAQTDLKSFKAKGKCKKDLKLIGLSQAKVRSLAGSVQVLNAQSAAPAVYASLQAQGADFGVVVGDPSYPQSNIYYDQNYFWQSSITLVMATLIHEISHVNGYTDDTDQMNLFGQTNPATINITMKLATDCFGYVAGRSAYWGAGNTFEYGGATN
jgi:RHS repeat-associated protein